MRLRSFGRTPLRLSELGFGAWAIGGTSFGSVAEADSLGALARAEEHGCNFVDTAAVYGDSERIVGQFLEGRRERWVLASKYSGQAEGLAATLDAQLRRLRTDRIDLYQLHWMPGPHERELWDQLAAQRDAGKIRFVGVSLYSATEIDAAMSNPLVDGLQVRFGLLDPLPFLRRLDVIRRRRPGIIVRSALKDGFLSGKYDASARFNDSNDQRSRWLPGRIAETARAVDRMRFLGTESRPLRVAALRYPLAFDEVSTVIVSTKSGAQASDNFMRAQDGHLDGDELSRVREVQEEMGLLSVGLRQRAGEVVRRLLRGVRRD